MTSVLRVLVNRIEDPVRDRCHGVWTSAWSSAPSREQLLQLQRAVGLNAEDYASRSAAVAVVRVIEEMTR